MRRILFIAGLMSLALFAGCNEESKATKEAKTVKWYTEHPAERKAQLDICNDNPGVLKDDPNCINAGQSLIQNSGGKWNK